MLLLTRKKRRKFRRGHAPYLTKIRLYWCDHCNAPRFENTPCSVCGELPRRVSISPPGDPFPAMEGHLRRVIDTVDDQFGEGVGSSVFPSDKPIVLNKVSSLDAMYEVIVDGYILGRLRFEIPDRRYKFVLSLEGGRRISKFSRRKWVSCSDDAIPYLKGGANLMVPGIVGCDSEIEVGDDVMLLDSMGRVIGVGMARMSGEAMALEHRGFAVKIREFDDSEGSHINAQTASWDDVVRANEQDILAIEQEAIQFIKKITYDRKLPVVVGFSGGKDSLVTYLLVEKALGHSPPLFFMDTGLELPETVAHVHEFAKEHGADIIGERAGDQFWESVEVFGPPARDFRWCCKVLKLGPAATAIAEKMGGATLSFMGQRRLESFQRSIEPRVTSNPWVPGQISANPIQRWNALEVWLYIFREKTTFNPLYTKGYHRMGCYLCPSSPLAELEQLKTTHPELYSRWRTTLLKWADRYGFPQEWADLGFWRWKHLPKGQQELAKGLGLALKSDRATSSQEFRLDIVKGVSPCVASGYSLEGQFTSGVDFDRVKQLLPIFGSVKSSEELGALRVESGPVSITLFSSGSVVIRGPDEKTVERYRSPFERAMRRALFCQACGSCIPQCKQNALYIADDGKIAVNPSLCINCLECDLWPCPTYLS
ncbi:MAG: phosphoadenosine phosphosulfate reductase family protein [Candidatus Thorarchaeota archaeon]|nr:phosphoadenosine phosphosulfate reductase family protein [Candidatus Thorarchaeota archaeon]